MIPASEKSGWRFAIFPAKGLKDDEFTARKHTRPVGRPHGKFYSSSIDVHSPMQAGEWNFTPLDIHWKKNIFYILQTSNLFSYSCRPRSDCRSDCSQKQSDQRLHCFYSVCIFWTDHSTKPKQFGTIMVIIFGVPIL